MSDAPDSVLPRQELLTKLLKMTTSANDGEALAAMRKANDLLARAGWDWDRLIAGKIRIVEDPFKNLQTPTGPTPASKSRPAYAPTPPMPPPPPQRPQTTPHTWPLGINPNRFASFCYCCGHEVVTNAGVLFRPSSIVVGAPSDLKVACKSCNLTATVYINAAPRQRPAKGKRHVGDLA
jgi:hypothetical protein